MPKHVLIVDDQADLRLLMRRALESEGYRVTAAGDASAAVHAVATAVPDVVVSDVMMPVTDGFALVEQLRSDARLAGVPVIFLTAAATVKGVEERARALGVDQFLAKPFNPRMLLATVRGTLERGATRGSGSDALQGAETPATVWSRIDAAIAAARGDGPGALVTDRTGATRIRDAWALTFRECAIEALRTHQRCAVLVAGLDGATDTDGERLVSGLAPLWSGHHVACRVGTGEVVVFALGEDRAGAASLAARLRERVAALAAGEASPALRCAVTGYGADGTPEGEIEVVGTP